MVVATTMRLDPTAVLPRYGRTAVGSSQIVVDSMLESAESKSDRSFNRYLCFD